MLISETAVGSGALGGGRNGLRFRCVRRELHDQGLLAERQRAFDRARGLRGVGAHDETRLDVGARHVQFDHRDLVALPNARDELRELVVAEAHHRDDERDGQLREFRQIAREEPFEALVRQPDRIDQAGGRLPQPRRRIALARSQGDRLRHESVERELLEQLIAERTPRGDRVERARPVQDGAAQRDPAELDAAVRCQCPLPGTSAVSSSRASTTGPSTQSRT